MNSYPKMYIIPGLGTDGRIFQQLRLQNLDFEVVEWETPEKNEPYETYLQRMAEKIRTDEPFVLAGVSFGGMCAQSLAPQLKPEKLVLISTIRRPDQFPFYLRHAIQLKMNRWVDGPTIKFFAKLVLPVPGGPSK